MHNSIGYNPEFIIYGDRNINYLETSKRKLKLVGMLNTYSLMVTVDFPVRIAINSATFIIYLLIIEAVVPLNHVSTDCLIMMRSSCDLRMSLYLITRQDLFLLVINKNNVTE
jgi:hypothetical protein